jgi:hypothetical protein
VCVALDGRRMPRNAGALEGHIYMCACTKLIERPALGVTTDERRPSIAAGKAARRRSSWPPRACHLDSFVAPLKQTCVWTRPSLSLLQNILFWMDINMATCTRPPDIDSYIATIQRRGARGTNNVPVLDRLCL